METTTPAAEFNWLDELKELAELPEGEHPDNWDALADRAGEWPTCACGQLCAALPRNELGAPEDQVLADLGYSFYQSVVWGHWGDALKTFQAIERRTTELLDAIAATPNSPGSSAAPNPPVV